MRENQERFQRTFVNKSVRNKLIRATERKVKFHLFPKNLIENTQNVQRKLHHHTTLTYTFYNTAAHWSTLTPKHKLLRSSNFEKQYLLYFFLLFLFRRFNVLFSSDNILCCIVYLRVSLTRKHWPIKMLFVVMLLWSIPWSCSRSIALMTSQAMVHTVSKLRTVPFSQRKSINVELDTKS